MLRRMMLKNCGGVVTSLVTVDKNLVNPYEKYSGYKYFFRITLSGNNYWYFSNYPFFAKIYGNGTQKKYRFYMGEDCVRNPGTISAAYIGRKMINGENVTYKREFENMARSEYDKNTVVSNYPIEEWVL